MRSSWRSRLGVCALAAGLTGCVLPDDVSRLRQDVGEVQRQLQQARTEQAAARSRLDALEAGRGGPDEQVSRADLADLKLRLEGAERSAQVC
ncbi:MAG TPA: hypothetical protein VJS92_15060, partial [Candidatus Polarisedimenticolaceae bacterium]|nr:hypothetical protein [Candidatus Polarisedimenticolaceae bacterium]